jgi:hypothetical protein
MTPDIYSLSFSCQIKDEILKKYFDIFTGKHKEEKEEERSENLEEV